MDSLDNNADDTSVEIDQVQQLRVYCSWFEICPPGGSHRIKESDLMVRVKATIRKPKFDDPETFCLMLPSYMKAKDLAGRIEELCHLPPGSLKECDMRVNDGRVRPDLPIRLCEDDSIEFRQADCRKVVFYVTDEWGDTHECRVRRCKNTRFSEILADVIMKINDDMDVKIRPDAYFKLDADAYRAEKYTKFSTLGDMLHPSGPEFIIQVYDPDDMRKVGKKRPREDAGRRRIKKRRVRVHVVSPLVGSAFDIERLCSSTTLLLSS